MATYTEAGYNADDMENIFDTSARILAGWWQVIPPNADNGWRQQEVQLVREWHRREQYSANLHPAVRKAMRMSRPNDWQELLLQWPHGADKDPTRLAYTQNERKGESNLQTITSLGKYLRMHFANLPDHAIRDLVAAHGATGCKFVYTTDDMIGHLHRGPKSCMVWDNYKDEDADYDSHPYSCYDPKYGWHMAVRIEAGQTVGRALCIDGKCGKYWVRSYKATEGYSPSDEMLEAWLVEQGYDKQSAYNNGEKLRYLAASGDDFLAPYIDGDTKGVVVHREEGYLRITEHDPEFECNSTGGSASPVEGQQECEDCGDSVSDGDGYWVGYHEDRHVCENCLHDNYERGEGRNGNTYYFDNEYSVEDGDGNYYHRSHLADNNMVYLHDEEDMVIPIDDAVCVDGVWYEWDDDRVCTPEDTNHESKLKDDCWQCAATDNWYFDTECVEVGGDKYHPDDVPETTE